MGILKELLDLDTELEIVNNANETDKDVLIKILNTMSSSSKFEDNTWIIDLPSRYKNSRMGDKTIYFNLENENYINLIKYFTLMRLGSGIVPSTINNNIIGIKIFLDFFDKNYKSLNLKDVNKKIINAYKEYFKNDITVEKRTKESYWTGINNFFKLLRTWDEMPSNNVVGYINPFSVKRSQRKSKENKYIPENIAIQLDIVMKNEEIPLYFRTVYWICRLIPNRITEVCSMTRDCIRPYINDKVVVIPTFKQDSELLKPKLKNIVIKEDGIGKYLLDLIREQIKISESLSSYTENEIKSNFLFLYEPMCYMNNKKVWKKCVNEDGKVNTFKADGFNRILERVCKIYNIVDENGEVYRPTSHQFRHVGVTDRLYEGFRVIDVMSMTNHYSSRMITQDYLHIKQDELDKKSRMILEEEKPAILFNGRIINLDDERKEMEILRRPFAHRLGRLGLCSDISNCKSKMFECLKCDDFVPNADELEYFEAQVEDWLKKVRIAGNNKYLKENAQYNLELNQKIVEKIKLGLSTISESLEVIKNND